MPNQETNRTFQRFISSDVPEPEFQRVDLTEPIPRDDNYSQITERTVRSMLDMLDNSSMSISTINKFKIITSLNINKQKDEMKYKDDDLITLRNGTKAKYSDCVYVYDYYYLKTDTAIVKDYFNNNVLVNKKDCHKIYPYFINDLPDINKPEYYRLENSLERQYIVSILDPQGNEYRTLYQCIPKDHYTECLKTELFFHNNIKHNAVTDKTLKNVFRKVKNTKSLNSVSDLKSKFMLGIKSPTFIKTENKKYTYGIELETVNGKLPYYVDNFLNYECVRDGSLKNENGEEWGGEYVTGILTGDTGLSQLKRLCNELTKRCVVDKRTGMHIHLGNIDFDNELVVHLYKLFQLVENEIFNMMPLSRRKNEYCKKLKPFKFNFKESDLQDTNRYRSLIEDYYLEIYKFVSHTGSLPSGSSNKKTQHPLGAKCGYDHKTARYCWINLVPTLFDTRGNGSYTIEIRNHPGTTNFTKVKNYLLIFMGLIWFAENHKKTIALSKSITLEEIMKLAYPKTYTDLISYIKLRTNTFNSEDIEKNKTIETTDYNEMVESEDLTIKNL